MKHEPHIAPPDPGWYFDLGHRPALDGLRGLTVLAVMGIHTHPPMLRGGYLGVDLFFVLSGFLITALLVQEHRRGAISLRRFYLRRALRLLPALLAMLVFLWLYVLTTGTKADLRRLGRDTLTTLLYVHNWRVVITPVKQLTPQLIHVWSLAIEEQFYLAWPAALAFLLARKVRLRWVVGLTLAGVIVPSLLRIALWHGPPVARVYFATDTRADALSGGCLVGLLVSTRPGPQGRWGRAAFRAGAWLAIASLLAHVLWVHFRDSYLYYVGFPVVNLSAAVLIAALLWSPPPLLQWVLQTRPLGWLGRISYGTYLWNYIVTWLILSQGPSMTAQPWKSTPIIWSATLLLGALSHYVIERPFLRLGRRLASRTDSVAEPEDAGLAALLHPVIIPFSRMPKGRARRGPMPHTKSAKKHQRQSEKRRLHNRAIKKAIKTQIKRFEEAVSGAVEALRQQYNLAAKKLDKAAAKRVIHPNLAARKKSQLARALHQKEVAAKAPAS
jgi:ribosomal protein S20